MALPTLSELEASPEYQALRAILRAAETLAIYEGQANQFLVDGKMDSQKVNTYLRTMQGLRTQLVANDPAICAPILQVMWSKADDLVEQHASILANVDKRIAGLDEFLISAGLKGRELSGTEAAALRVKLEGAQAIKGPA